ncbi:17338_t:CDS:2, partial [Dentiscutata heterogama]
DVRKFMTLSSMMRSTETPVFSVLITQSTYTRGLIGEIDVFEILNSLGFEVIHRGRRGDGGVDIICKIRNREIWIQVKNWTNNIDVIRALRGVTCTKDNVIGVVVGNKFSPGAVDEANISEDIPHPIILTTKTQLTLTFLNLTLDIINRNPIKLPLYNNHILRH